MESRDYPTLQRAAGELPYPFRVVASGWSPSEGFSPAGGIATAPNVDVGTNYSHRDLRALYANARFVVVPLLNVSYAAGVNAILEGMAMGKAIIASDSGGVAEYVQDGVSGRVVPVGDAAALRAAIAELWEAPDVAAAMGRRNRSWIEQSASLERFAEEIAHIVETTSAAGPQLAAPGMATQ
jgi:glycosyltransferase involved in cell wall biosynthesis